MNENIAKHELTTQGKSKKLLGKAVWSLTYGILIATLAYTIVLLTHDYELTSGIIYKIHAENPLLIITTSIPLIFLFRTLFFQGLLQKERNFLMSEIMQLEKNIEFNSSLASKIGVGNFSTTKEEVLLGDKLSRALYDMQENLEQTYNKEVTQNWITQRKEIISEIMRRHSKIEELASETLTTLVSLTNSVQGVFFVYDEEQEVLVNTATYAYNRKKYIHSNYKIGQGLIGQVAYEKAYIYRKEIPDDYFTITSGILGDKKPKTLLISPFLGNEKLQGVLEIASLNEEMPQKMITLIVELSNIIGQTLFNLKSNAQTKQLLDESQTLTKRLSKNEEQLKKNARQMQLTQIELQRSNEELESKITEVEQGQRRLHALLENASEVITIYNIDGTVKYVSPSVKRILGFYPEEMIGRNRFERGEVILQKVFDELKLNPEVPKTFEYRYENKDKEILWLETVGKNLKYNPAINGIIFNTRDITLRKVAEKAQRLSGEMQALSENSQDMIIRIGLDKKIYYANPVINKYIGISSVKAIDNYLDNLDIHDRIKNILDDMRLKVIDQRKVIVQEITLPKINDEEKIVIFDGIPEFDQEQELETVLFVAHDITERKQIELEIEKKNKSITESINYAKRIQSAIIPSSQLIKQYLPESFVFYKPRDVVSGDFPWFYVNEENIYIAAVDCTGHGVPGALLSFIGYFILNNIVSSQQNLTVGEIMDQLHTQVRKTLKQDYPDANARDGMDIALCKINTKKGQLEFAGAHRPMYFIRDGKINVYKGDVRAIGGIPIRSKKEKPFVTNNLSLKAKDQIYIFSDGLPDQIGGEKGRKYQAKRIRNFIAENQGKSMETMNQLFYDNFINWKGKYKQIDDILLIGIEF